MQPRLAKCRLVSKVLVADGIMTENEKELLKAMMTKMGLSEIERRDVMDLRGRDDAEPIVAKLSVEEKRGASKRYDVVSSNLTALDVQARIQVNMSRGVAPP